MLQLDPDKILLICPLCGAEEPSENDELVITKNKF